MESQIIRLIILCMVLLVSPINSRAAVNLPWSTTFNYNECTQRGGGGAIDCATRQNDGITWGWGAASVDGKFTQVAASANNPNGAGGNGFRAWIGDGVNISTGPVAVEFPSPQKEMWIRWYQRHESGFKWQNNTISYDKTLYIRTTNGLSTGISVIPSFRSDKYVLAAQGTSNQYQVQALGAGWNYVYGSNVSDGSWHCYEIYIKMDTNQADGVGKLWIDGELKVSVSGVDWSGGSAEAKLGWVHFDFENNQSSPLNGRAMYVDYDDMAIYNANPPNKDAQGNPFIGPIGWGSRATVPPIVEPVNGACGSANGQSFTSLTPASPYLCFTGSVASFAGTGPWTWGCTGSDGGASTSSTACSASLTTSTTSTLLFSESFENNSYSSRGWYDNINHGIIVSGGQSGNALQWAWAAASTKPTNGGATRMKLTPTESLYVSYYVKFDAGWRGSGVNYHPHMLYILSDLDSAENSYSPLANNYLDTYLEFIADTTSPYAIRPVIAIQDEKRVNTSFGTPPNDLRATTENRSVAHCNTPVTAGVTGICYADNPYYSANLWKASTASVSPGVWHKVEVYLQMNTISGGKGISDGIMQEWINGSLVINRSDVLYRTAQDATKKWAQFVLAPYMSPSGGSPVAQTMWIDELKVMTAPPSSSSLTPPAGLTIKSITP